jgi:hypothetical protein
MGEKRKYGRVEFGDLGELSFRARRKAEPTRLCAFRDASASGAKLHVPDEEFSIVARESINVLLRTRNFEVELPARVVWQRRESHGVTFGIRWQLEIAASTSRKTYSQWIVARVQRAMQEITRPWGIRRSPRPATSV